jgi:hypothetical protein
MVSASRTATPLSVGRRVVALRHFGPHKTALFAALFAALFDAF